MGKPKVISENKGPKVVQHSQRVHVSKVSLNPEVSGWRDLDEERVQELLQAFDAGQYGQNLFRAPRLLVVSRL